MAVLSLSRQFGAGGKTLGGRVAKRLDYQFIDEGILCKVAEEANVSLAWVEGVEKEAGGRLMRFLSSLVPSSFIERHVGESGSDFDENKYVEFLSKIVRKLADEDNVVILGRASQFILRENPDTIRVLLVAERPDRIQFMVDHYNLDAFKAEKMVTREEKKRERFLQNFYNGDPDDPGLYHLVINTSNVDLDIAEGQICDLVLRHVDYSAKPIWD